MPAEEVERWTAGSPGRDHHTESDTKRPTEGSFACSPRPTFVVSLTISVPSTMSNRHTAVAVVGMNELGVSCAVAEWRTVARSSTVLATAPLRQAGGGNVYFAALIRACAFTESLLPERCGRLRIASTGPVPFCVCWLRLPRTQRHI